MTCISNEKSHDKFITLFSDFLKKGVMAGTYKAVFLRALTDIGKYEESGLVGKQWIHHDGDKIKLDLDFIAIRFIKYYWDMEVAFQMRHMPERMADADDSNKDTLNIIKLIRDEAALLKRNNAIKAINDMSVETLNESEQVGNEIQNRLELLTPPTLDIIASDEMKTFRENVISKSIKPEVLKNLLNDMPDLYQRVRAENYIILDASIIGFMEKFYLLIRKALNCVLAEHLEKNNPSARHIAIKIDSEKKFESKLELIKKLESQDMKKLDDKVLVESLN